MTAAFPDKLSSDAPDITERLAHISRCRRYECRSCEDGYENYSHYCTNGPHCVETQEILARLHYVWCIVAGQARDTVRQLRVENAALRARIELLDSIHHG